MTNDQGPMTNEEIVYVDDPVIVEDDPVVDAEVLAPRGQPCGVCGAPIEPGDRFCTHCGSASEDARLPARADANNGDAELVIEGPKKHIKCQSCGAKIKVDPDDMSCSQNQRKRDLSKIKLPDKIPQPKVKAIMERIASDLHTCYSQFGVSGDMPVNVTVAPTGKIVIVKVAGKHAGTPTAQCVERLVQNAKFPKFSGEQAKIEWPFAIAE